MEAFAFNKALQSIWELVSAANKYIDDSAPWALAKDEDQRERLGTVMYNLLETVRLIGLLVTPFMPETGARICTILGINPEDQQLDKHDSWGLLEPGTMVEKATPLFPRIETE
jgi:methionyl-tRNA synthetase